MTGQVFSNVEPAGVDYAIRVTYRDGTTRIRHEDDPLLAHSVAEQMAATARRHPAVASAEVVYRQVWHGPWTTAPEPTDEADRG
ncbi:hypothetical protein ACGFIW_01845 [Micromonospora sp. NPDC048935]|uniref:hypothetical protein n=1 Tax=Micromonospora sp. NPDC048935 TaxID=3364262 RepID=UPI00370F8806